MLSRALGALRRFKRDTLYLQERLLELPWDNEGPLQWQRGSDGPKLVGSHLPTDDED
jgi:hypothetical protein